MFFRVFLTFDSTSTALASCLYYLVPLYFIQPLWLHRNQGYNRRCTYRHDTIYHFYHLLTIFTAHRTKQNHSFHFTLSQQQQQQNETLNNDKHSVYSHFFYDSSGKSILFYMHILATTWEDPAFPRKYKPYLQFMRSLSTCLYIQDTLFFAELKKNSITLKFHH